MGVPVTGGRTLALVDDAQPAGSLGDEQPAVRKEREAPRRLEILGDDFELDRLLFGLEDRALRIDLRLRLALQLTRLIADVEDELPDLFLGDEILEGHHRRSRASVADARRDARVVTAELPLLVHQAGRRATLEGWPVARGAELRDQSRGRIAHARRGPDPACAEPPAGCGGAPAGGGVAGGFCAGGGFCVAWSPEHGADEHD